ncbi:hypothetical protein E4U37_003072 [Claviceps purpurea]|nr:hypothetical protein E4U37_003072 [Claviceps purpurea]
MPVAMRCVEQGCRDWATNYSVFCATHESAGDPKSQQRQNARQAVSDKKSTAPAQEQKKK